jgi:farnesyl-diphosphate farnesyltransferase
LVNTAERFCRESLSAVSRTFALNIPALPEPLDFVVSVAYLLCRIADTVEDESEGTAAERRALLLEFARLCELPPDWRADSARFYRAARQKLRSNAPSAEVRLLRGTPLVLKALSALQPLARPSIARCIRVMTSGMSESMQTEKAPGRTQGLADLDQMLTYCYYVAGVVGEMLTELFVGFSPRVEPRSSDLMARAPAFGRALQLTNILRDAREDLDQGRCFLPRREMKKHGLTIETLILPDRRDAAVALFDELNGVARREADVAFEYALLIPPEETGIRLFCLWPLFFAVLTLRELEGNPAVLDPTPIKIRRDVVQNVISVTRSIAGNDPELRAFYRQCTSGAREGISPSA